MTRAGPTRETATTVLALLVVAAVLLAPPVASADGLAATPNNTTDDDGLVDDGTTNDTDGTINDSTNDTDGTLNDSTNDTDDTINDSTDNTDGTLNDSTNDTDGTINDTTNDTDGTINDSTDDGTLNGSTNDSTLDDSTDGDTLNGSTDGSSSGVNGTVNETTGTVENETTAAGNATDATDGVEDTTDAVENGSDGVGTATGTTDASGTLTNATGTVTDAATNATGNATVGGVAAVVSDTLATTTDGLRTTTTATTGVLSGLGGTTASTLAAAVADDGTLAGTLQGTIAGASSGGIVEYGSGSDEISGGGALADTSEPGALGGDTAASDGGDLAPPASVGVADESEVVDLDGEDDATSSVDAPASTTFQWFPGGAPTGFVAVTALATAALAGATTAGASALSTTTPAGLRAAARAAHRDVHDRLRRVPGIAAYRYSRYDDSDPLEHDVRARAYDVIEDDPGVHLSAIADATDASLSTVRHHLRVLEDERLVHTTKADGRRRYYPVGSDHDALRAALQDPTRAALVRVLDADGPAANGDLADALDRDPSTVTHHLQKLEDAGVVVRERGGRSVRNALAPDAADALPPRPDARTEGPMPADD